MEKITYAELAARFRRHESARPSDHLSGCIVFTEDSWTCRSNNGKYAACDSTSSHTS